MIKRQSATILVSTIIIMGVLSSVFLLQNVAFNAQLRARSVLIELTVIDNIQLQASLKYSQQKAHNQTVGEANVIVTGDKLLINYNGTRYTRQLLVKPT